MRSLASYIDHTLLKPTSTYLEIENICREVKEYGFAAACVAPPFVSPAHSLGVRVATVIGFPFGYSVIPAKMVEIEEAIIAGADELDVVHSLVAVKAGDWRRLEKDMRMIVDYAHIAGRLVKVIIESGELTDAEIVRSCELYGEIGVDFVKTSTGYATQGATVEVVRLMREHLPANVKIKASGGIRTYEFARELVGAGADRLGCSASVAIVRGEPSASNGY